MGTTHTKTDDTGLGLAPLVCITIRPDALSAVATVEAGKDIDLATFDAILADAGVCFGVDPDAIFSLCTGERRQAVIAHGQPPLSGLDTSFEPLVSFRREAGTPKVNDDGGVDYLDLDHVQSVHIGAPLMRRIPPTTGTHGRNVRNEEITCRDGHDRPFRRVGLGTRISADDPQLLVAAVSGLPTFGPDYVQVDPVLWLPAVDVSTGHIRFAGTVIVAGDVATGLRIEADRDIIVAGTVDAADLIAGGNVELCGGMVGHGTGRVQAGGWINARYLDNVTVSAGEDLFFEETISHCQVTVCRDVVAISALGYGQIIGGTIQAGRTVRVRLLGALAGTATAVGVGGIDPDVALRAQARVEQIRRDANACTRQLIQMRRAGGSGSLLDTMLGQCERLQAEMPLAEQRLELARTLAEKDQSIEASQGFYGGVEARIGDLRRTLRDDMPGAKLVARHGQITLRR
ncbi:MAG: DUF342 domain-containing protein [Candidatus Sericytochromatia bacterium]|nr:DUF342 domain-containing protein [Candidatus Sericytochromatia bacterium]